MSTVFTTRIFSTTMPSGFWLLTSFLPISSFANSPALSASVNSLTPPALPRPPMSTWAFTTTLPPSRSAMARASAGSEVTSPAATGTPYWARRSLDWYSWSFIESREVTRSGRRLYDG